MREGFFFMIQQIVKRDGRMAPFEIDKITNAIFGAAQASGGQDHDMAQELAEQVEKTLEETAGTETPTVEQVQDTVEKVLIESGHARTAKKYILYRDERTRVREMNTRLMKVYEDLTFKSSIENDIKRETPTSTATPRWAPCSSMAPRAQSSSMKCSSSTRLTQRRTATATSTFTIWIFSR